jgi:hypothetical protein
MPQTTIELPPERARNYFFTSGQLTVNYPVQELPAQGDFIGIRDVEGRLHVINTAHLTHITSIPATAEELERAKAQAARRAAADEAFIARSITNR